MYATLYRLAVTQYDFILLLNFGKGIISAYFFHSYVFMFVFMLNVCCMSNENQTVK